MNFTLKELILAGGPVLFFLTALSIYSLALLIERWKTFQKVLKSSREIILKTNLYLKANDLKGLLEFAQKSKTPAADIIIKLSGHSGNNLEKREFSEKLIEWHTTNLSKHLNALATIGSTAPFIGLFGTVIGVIRAFRDLSSFQGAGPSVVASGISEALVNTAAGLFVAVPAIVAYNYFISKINKFSSELNWISEQLIARSPAREYLKIQ
ncbi:MAG: flagellar motor protein MotA [Elusimicrobia bacterium CG08_land_8_20_14_0_20_51_18]|nr:MAG: flagellar motor protein MotA [Elusimicrobia bacterium CG08_land_8_20_14_0_20_51_18]